MMKLRECYKKVLAMLMAVCVLGAGIGAGISVQGAENDDSYSVYGRYQTDDEYQPDDEGLLELYFTDDDDEYIDEMYLKAGQSEYLFLASDPEDAWLEYEDEITWESSRPGVASVEDDGEVTAKRTGTTVITAVWDQDDSVYAECLVTVAELKLKKTSFTMPAGSDAQIQIKSIYPKDDDVYYESSNNKVAKVSDNGKITAVRPGKAVITVESDSEIKVKCRVTVKKPIATKKLSIKKKDLILAKGAAVSIKVKRAPRKASDKLTWKSSNKRVATVDNKGRVVARKSGKAVITVKSASGKTAACTIEVAGVKLAKNSATIRKGETVAIKVKSSTIKNDKIVSYRISDAKVVMVDKKGIVKGRKAGKANIQVKMKSGATAVFKVTVK